jgi:hypothetical protein
MKFRDTIDIKNRMIPGERRLMSKHIIVCPFCEKDNPVPLDFDAIHRCGCGACYKVCGNMTIEVGVGDIAEELWTAEELDFVKAIPTDCCNVVIQKDFDRLLNLKQNTDSYLIERFCKYDTDDHLNLVWVRRLY